MASLDTYNLTAEALPETPFPRLVDTIMRDWPRPWFGAVPYLRAMLDLDEATDAYGYDGPGEAVLYFLSNAAQWKGETAKAVKAELRRRLGMKAR